MIGNRFPNKELDFVFSNGFHFFSKQLSQVFHPEFVVWSLLEGLSHGLVDELVR